VDGGIVRVVACGDVSIHRPMASGYRDRLGGVGVEGGYLLRPRAPMGARDRTVSKFCTVNEALKIVAGFGRRQLKKYNLKGWKFLILTNRQMDSIQALKNEAERTPDYYMLAFCCHAPVRVIAVRRSIIYSKPESVRKLILHEIAHALCAPDVGHGKKFRAVAKRIGGYQRKCV
jgi:hypothetical protein